MSSTQDPTENTPSSAQPTDSTASQEPTDSTPSQDPTDEGTPDSTAPVLEETPASEPVDVHVSLEMMLFEAGMIANSLSSKSLGAALADRLYQEEQAAESAKQSRMSFRFTPFEAGMALSAMSRSADNLLDELIEALSEALSEKMQELGINGIDRGQEGGLGGGSL